MSNQRPSFAKRDREMKLKDKARAKAEKRAAKKAAKAAGLPGGPPIEGENSDANGEDGTVTAPSMPATPTDPTT
jgi:hypothetical protein